MRGRGSGLLPEPGPGRTIAAASFVNMLGTGMFTVSAALFYTQVVGLSVAQVGVGLGAGAVVGIVSGIPIGQLADRRGAREVYLLTLSVQALAMAALILVRTFWVFVLLVSVGALAQSASQAARGPIVRRFAGDRPARFRAYLRSVANLAGAIGALLAAVVIQINTHTAYALLILGNALTFLAAAAVIARLPRMAAIERPPGVTGRWAVLRDRPFAVLTVLEGVMSIHGAVLSFALPLWIVLRTDAPRWFVGAAVLLNTAMVVALQVRASRGVDSSPAAARAWRRSGWAFLLGMGLIGLTGGLPGWLAALVMLIGVCVHTVGELWQAAGSFELRYRLAPAHAQGQYSGAYIIGGNLAGVVAPSVLGLLCITWGAPGWWVMGGVFVAVGLAIPYVVRWAERTRPASPELA